MSHDQNLIVEIILKHVRREALTDAEAAAFEAWRAESEENRQLADHYRDEDWVQEQLKERAAIPSAELWKMVCERTGMEETGMERAPQAHRPWRSAMRIAAVVLLLLGIGISLYRRIDHGADQTVKAPPMAAAPAPIGIAGHYEQVQVLADGRRQVFDSTAWGAEPFPVRLPDGSQVLLCYGSSLRYPVAFDGNRRAVDLNGQACFNITDNKGAPFEVHAGHTLINVLGTRFNVDGYADDSAKTITLLNGKVQVQEGGREQVLRPLEQAVVRNGRITVRRPGHQEGVVALGDKEPYFEFNHTDLNTAMREIAKWYRLTVFNPEHVAGVSVSVKFMLKDPLDSNLAIIGDVERPNVRVERRGDSLFLLRGRQSLLSK